MLPRGSFHVELALTQLPDGSLPPGSEPVPPEDGKLILFRGDTPDLCCHVDADPGVTLFRSGGADGGDLYLLVEKPALAVVELRGHRPRVLSPGLHQVVRKLRWGAP